MSQFNAFDYDNHSTSNPTSAASIFDEQMHSPEAERSRQKILNQTSKGSKNNSINPLFRINRWSLAIMDGRWGTPATGIVSSKTVQNSIGAMTRNGLSFKAIKQYSNLSNNILDQIHTQGPNEVFYLI